MLDEKDKKIIDILSISGREPASNISVEIGLSVPAVIDRINKLQEAEIITGFKANINYKKLGMDVVLRDVWFRIQIRIQIQIQIRSRSAYFVRMQLLGTIVNGVLFGRLQTVTRHHLILKIRLFFIVVRNIFKNKNKKKWKKKYWILKFIL